jgi:hypothetical protein
MQVFIKCPTHGRLIAANNNNNNNSSSSSNNTNTTQESNASATTQRKNKRYHHDGVITPEELVGAVSYIKFLQVLGSSNVCKKK